MHTASIVSFHTCVCSVGTKFGTDQTSIDVYDHGISYLSKVSLLSVGLLTIQCRAWIVAADILWTKYLKRNIEFRSRKLSQEKPIFCGKSFSRHVFIQTNSINSGNVLWNYKIKNFSFPSPLFLLRKYYFLSVLVFL